MKRFFRKMQKISESYFVSLPKSWISQFALDKNSTVAIDIRSDGCLIINPKIKEEGKPEEEIVLTMIKTTPKDIVKNSLLGIEKIVVISDKKIEPNILQQIKFVIDRLPNTEIIEQSDQRIEIHNFDIGNVPTRKLIRRLFNLAEDMFENIRNDKKNELKSNYNNLRKFYYILVTHTRMYFRTGIYVSEDLDITPLEILDYRTICYSIEKIGVILLHFQLSEGVEGFFRKVESYFGEIIDAFLNNDSEKSFSLWFERDKLIKEAEQLMKNLEYDDVDRLKDLVMIAHNCRDITYFM